MHEAAAGPRVPSSMEIIPEAMFGISIGDPHRAEAIGALAEQVVLGDVQRLQAADARRDGRADAVGLGMGRDVQPGIGTCLAGSGDGHLHEAIRAPRRAAVEGDLGIEVLDLAAELHRQPVERRCRRASQRRSCPR